MVEHLGHWGTASFENDAALEWFLVVEEAVDPGAVMAAVIDDAISDAEDLDADVCCEAIAAAELCACCAGEMPQRLPDNVDAWAQENPHGPHDDEVVLAVQAVERIREESALRELWDEAGDLMTWLVGLEDLVARLQRSGAGGPPTVNP